MKGREIIKWTLAGILVATVVGYSCFVLYDYLRGPRLIISNPESGFSTTTPIVTIAGRAVHANTLTINDAETPTDLSGNFQTRLILAEGYNIMKVIAKDRYDRTVEKTIELTLLRTIEKARTMGTTTIQATSTIN